MNEPQARPVWLCADDYGISPAVSGAIRELVVRHRLNATSVMVVAPSFDRSEAASLSVLKAGGARVAIGLHVTLTGPFRPLSTDFSPLRDGAFLPLRELLQAALLRRLSLPQLETEIASQFRAFVDAFGHPPDFVDGHQHVQLFPQIRDAFLRVVKDAAPDAWVRQCGRVPMPLFRRLVDRKALLLDALSHGLRKRAALLGIATNPAFAGAYDFTALDADFAELFAGFLDGMPADGVIMCHPGRVDAELQRLDPLTHQREREYDFLAGDGLAAALKAHGLALG
jgi:chitin disaccharide deacetylase